MGHCASELPGSGKSEYLEPKKKAKKYNSETIEDILHGIPLKNRIGVTIEMWLQSHLVDIGVIPDGYWSDEKEKKYGKLFRRPAKDITKQLLKTIEEWEKDGRPK